MLFEIVMIKYWLFNVLPPCNSGKDNRQKERPVNLMTSLSAFIYLFNYLVNNLLLTVHNKIEGTN